jgi:AcrR family transcriptional regulator
MAEPRLSSPLQTRRRQELELRRADVLAAATAVFAERGFNGAQVSEIASRAQVSNSTIYGLFDGKEELYLAVLRDVSLGIRSRVGDAVDAIPDPVERLLAVVDALVCTFETDRQRLHLFLRDSHALPWKVRESRDDQDHAVYGEFSEWITKVAENAREAGRLRVMSPGTFAHFLLGSVATALMQSVEADPEASVLELGAELRAGAARLFEDAE